MANLIKIVVVLLLVLPALIIADTEAASKCRITVSSKRDSSASKSKTSTYDATITNVGSSAAASILITPDVTLKSVTGLTASGSGYALPATATGIDAGATFTFTYQVTSGKTVKWTASSTCAGVTPTAAPTTRPTNAPTTNPTGTHTSAPSTTKAPTHTSAPTTTKAPTSAPTTKAPSTTTKAPTAAPTSAPTTSSGAASGRVCPSGTWWAPSPLTTWQWQLTGTIDTSYNVQMYDIDLFDNTAATISTLHSQGRVVICYFSTQYENWRPDASSFTAAVIGNALDGWTGENYVDIRSTVVRNIMTARMDLAVTKGCDGLEPDNVDGYENDSGFPLTAADQLNFNEFIATNAHSRGLSVGLKNDVDQSKSLEPYFDWALDEQCYEYSECDTLTNFVSAGKAVFNCEYSGSASSICPYMVGLQFSSLMKGLDLTAAIKTQCCTYESSPCAAVAHQCVSAVVGSKKRSLPAEENQTVEVVTEAFTTPKQEIPVTPAASSASTYSAVSLAVAGAVAVAVLNL